MILPLGTSPWFTSYPKRLTIKTSSSPILWPRCRFPEKLPSTNQLCGPGRRFVSRTNKWPRVYTVKNKHVKPSCHRVGNNDQTIFTPTATRCVTTQWAKTTRSPNPVRGKLPHPPPIPRIGVKRSTRRQNPLRNFFFSFLSVRHCHLHLHVFTEWSENPFFKPLCFVGEPSDKTLGSYGGVGWELRRLCEGFILSSVWSS